MLAVGLVAAAMAALPAPACAGTDAAAGTQAMNAYAASAPTTARQLDTRRGSPASVRVQIPPIAFTGPGQSSSLPFGPCQTIYRYAYADIAVSRGDVQTPFRYAEVDWNTEGLPRGPNDSFSSPHFDFHLYLDPRPAVDHHTPCPSTNGRTCDPQKTSYAQMRRFLSLPPAGFLPRGYYPDTGSSIPMMGLHNLDGAFDYSVDSVDHHPTLIYGTFDGKVLFAEASVTLLTLQDAIAAPGHAVSFPFRQPRRVRGGRPWPTRFVIRYLPGSGGFSASFEGFRTVR